MEAIGSASAVIALVTATLQSVRFIYNTVDDLRNGPYAAIRLAEVLSQLQNILQVIKTTAERCERILSPPHNDFITAVRPLLINCSASLSQFEKVAEKLKSEPGTGIWDKTKFQARFLIYEKKLKEMHDSISSYVQLFSIYFNVGGVDIELLNKTSLNLLSDQLSEISKSLEQLSRKNIDYSSRFEEFSRSIQTTIDNQAMPASRINRLLEEANASLQMEYVGQRQEIADMTATLDHIMDRLDTTQLESRSQTSQIDELASKFRELLKLTEQNPSYSQFSCSREDIGTIENNSTVFRLCSELPMKKQNVSKSNSRAALEDLRNLITSFLGSLSERVQNDHRGAVQHIQGLLFASEDLFIDTRSTPSLKRKIEETVGASQDHVTNDIVQDTSADGDMKLCGDAFKRFCRQAKRLKHTFPESSSLPPIYDVVSDITFSQRTNIGEFTIQARKRRFVNFCSHHEDGRPKEVSSFQIDFIPRPGAKSTISKLTLRAYQEKLQNGTLTIPPMVLFHRILPNSDEVFHIVGHHDVQDLQKWMEINSRSIRICDQDGRSLLNYALQNVNYNMVKFLVDSGADVDAVEKDISVTIPARPALSWTPPDYALSIYARHARANCVKILLMNGADPSVQSNFGEEEEPQFKSVFGYQLGISSIDSLKVYMDHGAPFIDPNFLGSTPSNLTPILFLAGMHARVCTWGYSEMIDISDKIALLLCRGADISRRDQVHGKGDYARKIRQHLELEDILMLLVTAGADVYAINDFCCSVFDVADYGGHEELWETVLTSCGYDIDEVIETIDSVEGHSSSVDRMFPCRSVRRSEPKLSFVDYLRIRGEKRSSFPHAPYGFSVSEIENKSDEYGTESETEEYDTESEAEAMDTDNERDESSNDDTDQKLKVD